ncbi:glutathione S-transferase [Amylibacter marinus]|uniref:Glutathione S-transferase n=1 Tax=Amylibacter marinus TaxID=1475483 RepID=A0ABQ5VUM6_9RHOB|nr:glutathione S-transferase [Amylibacter marinus]GLQ34957.1 glutathione S-transferase [Amylibacter marinus]
MRSTADYRLYCFGESGNAYKAALMLELCSLDWQAEFVDFFNGEARSADFLKINPMGEVPVLVHGDVTMTQSGVIQDYITDQTGQFAPQDEIEAREVLRWVLWDNHKLSSQAGVARFLNNFLPKDKRPVGAYDFLQGRLRAAYTVLNGHLADREWVAASGPTAADFSCCGYLYYPEEFGFKRSDWPHIDRWLKRISQLDGWKHPYDLMQPAFK